MQYKPNEIEPKWQRYWEEHGFYQAEDTAPFKKERGPKKYILIEFPYPSGEGLHVGHARSYSALDAVARKKRMQGFNVLFPIGWDAFGLPTENYAIRTGIHPRVATEKNIANYRKQLKNLGLSFDWSREVNTTQPKYYKWTQWIFLKLFEKGLAYQAEIPINWCPSCKIGLANEEVVGGGCERCGTPVEKKVLKQWMIKITEYADRLIEDLQIVDYPEKVKTQQINWIGKSYGTEIDFKVPASAEATAGKENLEEVIKVFTTRADTIFGVTALVLASEHPLVEKLITGATAKGEEEDLSSSTTEENREKVKKYIEESKKKSDFEREKLEKEKTGVFTGSYCINPANNEKVPIWVGDYVVAIYGGGAVMMVPAHDYRDYDFAKKYGLEIREVVFGSDISKTEPRTRRGEGEEEDLSSSPDAFVDYGVLINSGEFNGLSSKEAIEKITEWLEKKNLGRKTVQYKLRDWVFSRQHYWGEPIPLVFCENCAAKIKNRAPFSGGEGEGEEEDEVLFACQKFAPYRTKSSGAGSKIKNKNNEFNEGELLNPGWITVPENDLPVELPYVEKYQPTGTGQSPLAAVSKWLNTKCPKCGGRAQRETDTMPNWAGSNWYYMRYCDPDNNKVLAAKKKLEYWLPVDWYNGGFEHTTLHLLYSRFIYKFLYDIGIVPTPEPYQRRTSHGIVLAEDGRKMSKSFGNVINPDDIVKKFGADTLRLYEMFMGPFDQTIVWNIQGVKGVYRFLEKVWKLTLESALSQKSSSKILKALHKLNKKTNEDLEATKFNTAVAAFMEFVNLCQENKKEVGRDIVEKFLILLSPFAPHITEELWSGLGHKESISLEKWPEPKPELLKEEKITLIIQVNGKVRDKIEVEADISEEKAKDLAVSQKKIKDWLEDREIKKVIFVPGKLINIVI